MGTVQLSFNGCTLHLLHKPVGGHGPLLSVPSTLDLALAPSYNNWWVCGCPHLCNIAFGIGICLIPDTCYSDTHQWHQPTLAFEHSNKEQWWSFHPQSLPPRSFRPTSYTVNATMGYMQLPVMPLPPACPLTQGPTYYSTLLKQFCAGLLPWQHALFGTLCKACSTSNLLHLLQPKTPVMIVSNASIQKSSQSGFAWLIAHNHPLAWWGTGLAPGPKADTYSGCAKAYSLLAAITFLAFYVRCNDTLVPPQTIKCYCDNSGIIAILTSMQHSTILQPNNTTNDGHNLYATITAMATSNMATHQATISPCQRSPRPTLTNPWW